MDSLFLRKAQAFCDWLYILTGITKYTFAKWLLIIHSVCFVQIGILMIVSDGLMVSLVAMLFFGLLGDVLVVFVLEKDEKNFRENPNVLGTSTVWFSQSSRILFTCVYGFMTCILMFRLIRLVSAGFFGEFESLFIFFLISFIGFIYVNSCLPRPPGKNKLRQKYEDVLVAINDWVKGRPDTVSNPSS